MDPLKQHISEQIYKNRESVSNWFEGHFKSYAAPIYSSYDIRDSGYKIAPVDFNLFPAGFNNICEFDRGLAPGIINNEIGYLAQRLSLQHPKKIVVLPESHTSNKFYLENLRVLTQLLSQSGLEVQIGWINTDGSFAESMPDLITSTGVKLTASPIQIINNKIVLQNGFTPDWIILNNDFSAGYPSALDSVTTPILPSYKLGWHSRRKSNHICHYNQLVRQFSELIQIDPWIFQVNTQLVTDVDFNEGVNLDRVKLAVERVLTETATSYKERGITDTPVAFIKANSGTYGMGIHTIKSPEEIQTLNRRSKNKLSTSKGKQQITQIIVQEGIPSQFIVDGAISEPVVYMFGCQLLGGFLRSNQGRGALDNLNSPGMVFQKLCMRDLKDAWLTGNIDDFPKLEAIYGSLSRIAAIASSIEGDSILNEKKL